MSKINKSAYYARLSKTLKKHDISIEDYKASPYTLFAVDYNFRSWIYSKFSPTTDFTWYGNKLNWANLITPEMYSKIENENLQWSLKLQHSKEFDSDEDDLFLSANADSEVPSAPKKAKITPTEQEAPTSSQKDATDSTSVQDPVPGTSGSMSSSNKRKPEESSGSQPKKVAAENTAAGVSNLASKINAGTTEGGTQANPSGEGEVDQNKDQQLQTPRGNAHNERGTLQGEAGNLKIQKPLEKYGIVKVRMSFNKHITKVFIFLLNDKDLSNDLVEMMEETYESGEVFTHKIDLDVYSDIKEKLNGLAYIVAWKLPFNIGYPKIISVLGNRYGRVLTFTKNIDNIENINEILEHSLVVRVKNDVKLFTLAEAVERAQADYDKYKSEPKKRKRASRFD